jgi:hypothetical protein
MSALVARRNAQRALLLTAAFMLVALGGAVGARPAQAAPASSAKTLKASAYDPDVANSPFPDLEVTVSQTANLVAQGITISYKGGVSFSGQPDDRIGGVNFLQVMECWGDDPNNPGHPDRRTCQYGTAGPGSFRDGTREADTVLPEDQKYSAAAYGGSKDTSIPFVAWNTQGIVDENKAPADKVLNNRTTNALGQVIQVTNPVNMSKNTYFTANTSNELKWAPFGADGTGSVPFEAQTAMEAPGLGCGNPVTVNGTTTGSSCWLVIIPRGMRDNGSSDGITTSGLYWDSWKHHLAVKLSYKPLGASCRLGATERQLAGSELVSNAVASWQPAVCQGATGAPFTLAQIPEADAAVTAAGTAPSALALTSRPVDKSRVATGDDPLAYAPVALGGITVSFVIQSEPSSLAKPEYQARRGLPLTAMKLTPRLLAKLLTASYSDAVPPGANASHLGKNPRSIVYDPDFQAINDPEWSVQAITDASVSDALEPLGRSDLAVRVWEYLLADPEAKSWLEGEPDPWGMKVNPWYSTNATINPSGQALDLPSETFAKADPIEKPDTTKTGGNGIPAVNLVTWRPYTASFADGANRVLRGDGLILGGWDKLLVPPAFAKSQRQVIGRQHIIALSTTPAAERRQTAIALLRNPAGQFVAPTTESLAAAAAAMTPTEQPQVVRFDPASAQAKAAAGAYPLTIPVYAALNPLQTDAAIRASYADLITFAASTGQTPGTSDGQLPPGYAPIPATWKDQALKAAAIIKAGVWPSGQSTPTAVSSTSSAAQSAPSAGTTPTTAPVQQTAAGAPSSSVPATNPAATGATAPSLSAGKTGDDPSVGALAAVVPVSAGAALAAALAIPPLTRRRRL